MITDIEKSVIQRFVDNEVMRETIKKELLCGIKDQLAVFNKEFTNEQIGANLRACDEGIKLVESAFNKMLKYQTPKEQKIYENPAR